jgi:hypothetical protein
MSNTPIDWPLLTLLGIFGVLFWYGARNNASPEVWRWLKLQDKFLSVFLLVASLAVLGLIAIYSRLMGHLIGGMVRSLLNLVGLG